MSPILLAIFSWINTFTSCSDQENNDEEVIADVILSTESWSNSMDNVEHKNDSIYVEIDDNIQRNEINNDWSGHFI